MTMTMVRQELVDLQKTSRDVPNEFRVSGCKQESRLITPLGLGTVKDCHDEF